MYTNTELIDTMILELNKLEVKGVANMAIIIETVQKLAVLKKGLEKDKEERRKAHESDNEQRESV